MSKKIELLDTKSNPFPAGTCVHGGGDADDVHTILPGQPVEVPDAVAASLLVDFPRAFKVTPVKDAPADPPDAPKAA